MARLFTGAGIATTTLRRIAGVRARRPSAFNACVGAALRGRSYPRPAPGMGGRRNPQVHSAFIQAVNQCKGQRARAAAPAG